MNHLNEFNHAWETPQFIKIELDPVDVNEVLKAQYRSLPELGMTRTQLWDMEVRKASRPDLFIPSVLKPGSAAVWGRKKAGDIETFTRVSVQRLWLDEGQYGTIIENVHIDHNARVVTFIGQSQASSDQHGNFSATTAQPIFHVQHGVIGDENNPQNTWKIVHLTSANEDKLNQRFQSMNRYRWLPEYVEIYLRDIMGIQTDRVG